MLNLTIGFKTNLLTSLILICSYCNAFSTEESDSIQFASVIESFQDSEINAKRLREKANYHLRIGEIDLSIELLDKSLSMTKDPNLRLDLLLTKSNLFFSQFKMEKSLTAVKHAASFITDKTSLDKRSSIAVMEATILHFIDRLSETKKTFSDALLDETSILEHSFNDRIRSISNNDLLWHYGDFKTGLNFFKTHISKGQVLHLAESNYFRFLGDIYLIRKDYETALSYYLKISTEDTEVAAISFTYYTRLIEAYMQLGDLKSTATYLEEVTKNNDGNPFKQAYLDYLTYSFKIRSGEMEDHSKPFKLIEKTEEKGLKFFTHFYALKLAEAYCDQDELKLAKDLVSKIPYSIGDQITDFNRKVLLKTIAEKEGNLSQIQKLESDINGMKHVLEVYDVSMEEIDNLVGEVFPLNQKRPISNWMKACFILFPLLFLMVYLLQRKRHIKLRTEKTELMTNYKAVLGNIDELEKDIQVSLAKESKEKHLQEKLAQREAEISLIEGSIEKQMHEKLAKLSKYQEKLASLKEDLSLMEKRTTGTLNLEIKQLLERLGSEDSTENFLELFANQFEQKNPDFVLNISKEHNLTEKQKVICYTVRNGISIHDTAQLLGTTKYAIKKARNRIWKQLEFESYDNFKQYIINL